MCGISGLVSKDPLNADDLAGVAAMNAALAHRGPDQEGIFQAPHVALAMRRLSIIDLAGGAQPLFNEDRSLVLIANGEIYNYIELRSRLIAKGHQFGTKSDCETILHLYEEHGTDSVQHLRGMFAFALWDSNRERLIVARDRLGEKPLYLVQNSESLIFASELKALLRSGLVPFELDPASIHRYFHYQYVPEPATPIKGVRKLDAAHLLTIDTNPWTVTEKRYWRMEDAPALYGEPARVIREELEAVSEIVIRSDVPVGIALSGGLDSSAVAALAVKKCPGIMHAFCVGYPGAPSNDERHDAKELADYLGMPFHDIELETARLVEFFPELVYLQDDPIADISGFGYYSVSRIARENGVPVVLQGQGGDELFWGYPWVRASARLSAHRAACLKNGRNGLWGFRHYEMPRGLSLKRTVADVVRSWGGLKDAWKAYRMHSTKRADQLFFYDITSDYAAASQEALSLYSDEFAENVKDVDAAAPFTMPLEGLDVDLTLTRLIMDTYLREDGMAQGDRLSMASSVELRLPLVDYKFVETVIGLRKTNSDLHLAPKALFRAALKDILPEWVLNRPKSGFSPPVREWHAALFQRYGHWLEDGFLVQTKVLTPEKARFLSRGDFPKGSVTPLSFKALVLETWCRRMTEHCIS